MVKPFGRCTVQSSMTKYIKALIREFASILIMSSIPRLDSLIYSDSVETGREVTDQQ